MLKASQSGLSWNASGRLSSKTVVPTNGVLIALGGLSLWLSFLMSNAYFGIALFFVFVISVVLINSKSGLADPRVFFLPFFFIYSIWFPLQILILDADYRQLYIDDALMVEVVNYSFLGAILFVIGATLFIKRKACAPAPSFFFNAIRPERFSERALGIVVLFLTILGMIYIVVSGASSKRELVDDGGPLISAAIFCFILLTAMASFVLLRELGRWKTSVRITCFIALSIVFMLTAGERDAVFRMMMIMAIIYFDQKRKGSFSFAMLMAAAAIVIVPFSQAFKSIIISGGLKASASEVDLDMILSNEFVSAGRNFYSLLAYGVDHSLSYIYSDILRGLLPSFFSSLFLDLGSTASWFNRVYRVDNGFSGESGWGFGLVAQGYLVAGGAGISGVMFIVGAGLGKLFSLRFKSEYWYVFFVMSAAASVYCIRADIGNFISQSLKVSGSAVLLIFICHRFLTKNNNIKQGSI